MFPKPSLRAGSIKKFEDRPLTREEAPAGSSTPRSRPNHKLTPAWRFYVLGPAARRNYGLALGDRKGEAA